MALVEANPFGQKVTVHSLLFLLFNSFHFSHLLLNIISFPLFCCLYFFFNFSLECTKYGHESLVRMGGGESSVDFALF